MTYICHTLTYMKSNLERMLKLKKAEAQEKKEQILNVLRELKEAYPNQIYKDLTKKNEKLNIKTMTIRTIQRKLNELEDEGLVEEHKHKYSLTKLAHNDLRYFNRNYAKQFGLMSLLYIMRNHIPSKNLEDNLQELIEIFGVYVVNSLIEALKPLDNNIKIKSKLPSTVIARDRLIENGVMESFHPIVMLQCFLIGINEQQKFNKNKSVEEEWIKTFNNKKFIEEFHQNKYISYPYYSIDIDTYNKSIEFLNNKYYKYYFCLFQAKADFYGIPKEFSLNNIREKISSYKVDKEKEKTSYSE